MASASDILLQREQKEAAAFDHALHLTKRDDLQYDLARLAAFDVGSVDVAKLRENKDQYLLDSARQNAQFLIHHIFSCPSEPFENGRIAQLPAPVFPLPRAKPVPKAREPTRWEKFAKEKGINAKKKKSKWEFNQVTKEWEPKFGYKRTNNVEDDWVIEAKDTDVVGEDPFLKGREDKREKLAKQKKREERNFLERTNPELAKQMFRHAPQKLTPEEKEAKKKVQQMSFSIAQTSTGSLGKFDDRLEGEKKPKPLAKPKRDPVIFDAKEEKSRSLKVLGKVIGSDGDFNTTKAANRYIAFEQKQAYENNKKRKGKSGGGSAKKKK